MNPFKWTNVWILVLFHSFVRISLPLSLVQHFPPFNQNDDHMFWDITYTEMTQLAIASELTRSHYLLIPCSSHTVSLAIAEQRLQRQHSFSHMFAEFICQRYYRTNSSVFIPMSFQFVCAVFFFFCWLAGSLSISIPLCWALSLIQCNFNVDSFRFHTKFTRFTWTV